MSNLESKTQKTQSDFNQKAKITNIDDLYSNLCKSQEEDSQCNKYPRLKKRDDTSIVYFEI